MAKFELKLPKMGESVAEATITSWLKNVGDTIEEDEAILEIATDKVDSEVPSEVNGVLLERLFEVDDVVKVGQVLAVIETDGDGPEMADSTVEEEMESDEAIPEAVPALSNTVEIAKETVASITTNGDRFYSPLVKNIAKKEGILQAELDTIPGTGKEGRVTKNDILGYLEIRTKAAQPTQTEPLQANGMPLDMPTTTSTPVQPVVSKGEDEIIEMTRMGKLVAKHMMDSVQTSAHVQ
ncbi:MAG: E3 binding domain-containing protein, partial [Bacteroidia bacterium]|nr:E3 binding domain-containing protein [Bacteroidia bacterium]